MRPVAALESFQLWFEFSTISLFFCYGKLLILFAYIYLQAVGGHAPSDACCFFSANEAGSKNIQVGPGPWRVRYQIVLRISFDKLLRFHVQTLLLNQKIVRFSRLQ